ncbi:MAG: OsmC family peroxiredoxin [Chitinophagia bacterium]|nr:OsmC family peroxiredoxin [Chitinophagia bacterium]
MTSQVIYLGDLRTSATHIQSNSVIETDAPIDNQGKGARFSPTDLVATALSSCMLTIMGIAANTHNIDITNTQCNVEKIMETAPRRIGKINIEVHFPKNNTYSEKEKMILEKAALTCPVMESLHPDCIKNIQFLWP